MYTSKYEATARCYLENVTVVEFPNKTLAILFLTKRLLTAHDKSYLVVRTSVGKAGFNLCDTCRVVYKRIF